MSWFEKAKTALIEALDIQEDERGIENSEHSTTTQAQQAHLASNPTNRSIEPAATTNTVTDAPVTSAKALPGTTISTWGSFTGSFFENPKAKEMITTAPTSVHSTIDVNKSTKRNSSTSNSDSIDLLSNTATSPTDVVIQQTPSDELTTTTSPSSEIAENDTALPDSIVIIDTQSKSSSEASNPNERLREHVKDSDSTQSFEELQMQTSVQTIGSDDKTDFEKLTTPSYSSPPLSNDEIETATSSDIEIISNPNGDSSSTNSMTRTSPLKLKKFAKTMPTTTTATAGAGKDMSSNAPIGTSTSVGQARGHCREPSEISILSEDSQTELDKLVQRISELNEILEARELRLLQSERQNAMLQERNQSLQNTIDNLKSNTQQHDSTQQLSALEKKFQTSLQECDALRIQIKTLKDELQRKIPKQELEESRAMVSELQLEGEKLSKEILHQSNIIKKLRAKEKTSEATLKKNAEQLAQLTDEVERLKKTLSVKEEIERTQIESIHKLSSEKRKLSEELAQQRSKVEDLQSKLGTVQTSFEAVKSELQQRTRLHTDLSRTAEEAAEAKKAKEIAAAENEEMLQQLNELREKLRTTEQHVAKREQQLREENRELMRRLEAAELRAESSTEDVSMATIPLLRQIESLQKTLNQRTNNWNKDEKQLQEQLEHAETRLKALETVETTFQEQNDILRGRCIELEEQLSKAQMQAESAKISQRQAELDFSLKETNLNRQISQLRSDLEVQQQRVTALEEQNHKLETKVQTKTASTETMVTTVLSEANVGEATRLAEQQQQQQTALLQQRQLQRNSPPQSFGVNSLDDAIGGQLDWQVDDLDCISNADVGAVPAGLGHGLNLSFMSNNTTTLEHLQSLLKQRDGEVSHLQWELSRLQAERNVYNEEISNLTTELENLKEQVPRYEAMERSFADLQTRYEALLEMYGEKVERMQELELDLIEARQAYKIQIDELLSQRNNTAPS